MSYATGVLQPDEHVVRVGRVHWIVYLRPLLLGAICLLFLHLASRPESLPTPMLIGAAISGVLAVIAFARASLWKWATELAVTNRRVIYKRGLLSRDTVEMNMGKVETVEVQQSLLGRLLGYGTLQVKGTGQSIEQLRTIARPLALRNAILAE
ncbi:MAG: PH domain-containing protein [Alphaproteobacteria bacterium]|nr:PH domain-containing protein [Alphaproteobacteria bacterium]MBV8409841.1 PH domain-containing protein [Alphaproteobacteria bacterium]